MGRHATRDVDRSRSRQSRLASAKHLPLVLLIAASAAWTAPSLVAGSSEARVSHGPWINRTLIGGTVRDLSIQELKAMNRARGIAFPR